MEKLSMKTSITSSTKSVKIESYISKKYQAHYICFGDWVRVEYLTIANQDCSTPNALATSFLRLSCRLAKWDLAGLRGVGTVFTNVEHFG
jgi:hypothetical protein